MKKETKKYIYAVGRRKRSVARVRLYEGKGQILVNEKPAGEYFRGVPETGYTRPFYLTKTVGKFFATARVTGGGLVGQLNALAYGISRALIKVDPEKFRKPLKAEGFLTRDPREKERRKPGLAQKARAGKQSPKR